MKKITFLLVSVLSVLASTVMAQTISIPYQFGFEDSQSAELANWHINEPLTFAATDSTNRWVIGTSVKNEGKKALYISRTANGDAAEFGEGTTVMYAYRDLVLPTGSYILSFDWKCFGSTSSSLSACVGMPGQLPAVSTVSASTMTTSELNNCKGTYGMLRQKGQNMWQNTRFSFRVNANTPTLRLVFIWEMNNSDATLPNKLGACIDNIQISSANCTPPTNLEVQPSCDTTYVTWNGYSGSYIVEYRKVGDSKWHSRSGLTSTSVFFEGLSEGSYDFRVRGICGSDSSVYTYKNAVSLFCEDEHCINYVNFTDPNVHCYYGTFENPEQSQGVVDFGSESMQSRHTVNWEQNVYDPRTGNQLPLVPPGEMATVRLGNWNTGAEAERIVYDYLVDSASSILLLKYAVVLEDPSGHGSEADKFTLEIRDAQDNLIDVTCGQEFFQADSRAVLQSGTGWHEYTKGYDNVFWKEWTTMGLDLTPWLGQLLKIAVTSYDCNWSGHFGYAYFTLGCASAKISTVSCGSDTLSIAAPEGFTYEWRKVINGVAVDPVLSTKANFAAPDTTAFQCHLTQIGKSSCSFDLYSSVIPRFPVSSFDYTWSPKNCYNRVLFKNDSHVLIKYDGDSIGIHMYNEPCEDYEWLFTADDGSWSEESSETNPIIYFPNTGGDFTVQLKAFISDGLCHDVMTKKFHVPAIGAYRDTLNVTICYGETYQFGDRILNKTGLYGDTLANVAGCDSIQFVNLVVNPVLKVTPADTLCYEDMVALHNADVAAGLTSTIRSNNTLVRYLQSKVTGCDSIVTQPFYPEVRGVVDTTINADGTVNFIIRTTAATHYTWQYYSETPNDVKVTDSLSTSEIKNKVRGTYTFTFYNRGGCQKDTVISMCHDWIYQRWDDVLSLCNLGAQQEEKDSANFVFKDFQWYKNDQPINGATNSYYYEADGLDLDATYILHMTRVSDGQRIETCELTPVQYNAGPAPVRYRLYTVDGILLAEGATKPSTPQVLGIYVMHIDFEDGSHKAYTIPVK